MSEQMKGERAVLVSDLSLEFTIAQHDLGDDWERVLGHVAEQLIHKGYGRQSEPRAVRTVEELEALPFGTVVLDSSRNAAQRGNMGWHFGGNSYPVDLPARVLTAQPTISAEQAQTMIETVARELSTSYSRSFLVMTQAWSDAGLTVAGESDG